MLSDLDESNGKLTVLLKGGYNNGIHEIFVNHPKREFFDVAYMVVPPEYHGDVPVLRTSEVLNEISEYDTKEKPVFYGSTEDEKLIKELPENYIVCSFSAGSDKTLQGWSRSVPKSIASALTEYLVSLFKPLGYEVVVTGKDYHSQFGREEVKLNVSGCINLVNKLSVAGSLKVWTNSKGLISAHSAPIVAAWYNRIPNIDILPPSLYEQHILKRDFSVWGFGLAYEETSAASYTNLNSDVVLKFFNEVEKRNA